MLPSNGWCPGPGEGGQKLLHLWCHSQKTRTPQAKKFFRMQTTRLAASFDTSTRSITRTGALIFPRKATCDPAVFLRTAWISPDVKVKLDMFDAVALVTAYHVLRTGRFPRVCGHLGEKLISSFRISTHLFLCTKLILNHTPVVPPELNLPMASQFGSEQKYHTVVTISVSNPMLLLTLN